MWAKEICFDNSKLKLGHRIFCTPHDGAEVRLRFIIQRLEFKGLLQTNHDIVLSLKKLFLTHWLFRNLQMIGWEVFILIWWDIFIQKIILVVCQSQSFADGPRQGWTPNKYFSHITFWSRLSKTTGYSYKLKCCNDFWLWQELKMSLCLSVYPASLSRALNLAQSLSIVQAVF